MGLRFILKHFSIGTVLLGILGCELVPDPSVETLPLRIDGKIDTVIKVDYRRTSWPEYLHNTRNIPDQEAWFFETTEATIGFFARDASTQTRINALFECRFGIAGNWSICEPPVTLRKLENRQYLFEVRARDDFENVDDSPASITVVVVIDGYFPPAIAPIGLLGACTDSTLEKQYSIEISKSTIAGVSDVECRQFLGGWANWDAVAATPRSNYQAELLALHSGDSLALPTEQYKRVDGDFVELMATWFETDRIDSGIYYDGQFSILHFKPVSTCASIEHLIATKKEIYCLSNLLKLEGKSKEVEDDGSAALYFRGRYNYNKLRNIYEKAAGDANEIEFIRNPVIRFFAHNTGFNAWRYSYNFKAPSQWDEVWSPRLSQTGEQYIYTFTHHFGDCPSGCLDWKMWCYSSLDARVTRLGVFPENYEGWYEWHSAISDPPLPAEMTECF